MDNMQHYNNLKAVPKNALKEITFGSLKGKSDINPQWRYEVLTQEFGICGIGWRYDIVKTWTQEANDGQIMLFVEINLYVKDGDLWSFPIPAIGGDFLMIKDKNGLHGNDEAYKMATTDALGVAMKMLGVAADVYRGLANDSKYGREPQQPPQSTSKPQNNQTNTNVSPAQQKTNTPQLISELQRKKLFATATEKALSGDDMKKIIAWKYKVDSSTKLTTIQASYLIDNLDVLWSQYVATQSKAV